MIEKNNIDMDGLDVAVMNAIAEEYPAIGRAIDKGASTMDGYSEFSQDVMAALYKISPEPKPETPVGTELCRKELDALMESSQYREMHDDTMLDDLSTALASQPILSEVATRFSSPEFQDMLNKQKEVQQEQERQQQEQAEQPPGADTRTDEEKQAQAEANQKAMDEKKAALQQSMEKNASAIRRAVTAGLQQGADEVEAAKSATDMMGWSLFGSGDQSRLPVEKKLELVRKAKGMKKKAELIGRMRQIAIATRKSKLEYERVELHGIETGDALPQLLQSELAMACDPDLEDEFLRRFCEKECLQYQLHMKDFVGRGPIICLIDSSGSMTSPSTSVSSRDGTYSRDDAAKAVAFGFAEIARTERRDFAWALFSGSNANLITGEAVGGRMTPDEQLRFLSTFIGGGTDYEQPLRWAMNKIGESRYNKADIVLITDGECTIFDEFQKKLEEFRQVSECRVWMVYVDECRRGQHPWVDGQWSDLLDGSAKELFGSV